MRGTQGTIRERARSRTVDASTSAEPRAVAAVVVTALVLAWALTYWAGGSRTAGPHAFYIAVVVAAMRFGYPAALGTSLVAGILAGPLLPLNVDEGTSQDLQNWVARLVAFVVVGQLVAFLSRHSMTALTDELSDRRFRAELEAAIAAGQLSLEYQPVVDLATGDLVAVEALVRWNHPALGRVPPSEFVPRAEQVGCVQGLTRHVLAEACCQLERWRSQGRLDGAGVEVAVNVSAADIADPEFCGFVRALVEGQAFPADRLRLEVTETALVDDIDTMVRGLDDLRSVGVRLAIDDFGTGESSLGHLQRFPIDTLKIDRVFVSAVAQEERNDIIAHGIVALARAMHLATVAEGIETAAQAQVLRAFGCTYGQGFLFSRPVDVDAIDAILDDAARFRDQNRALVQQPPEAGDPVV